MHDNTIFTIILYARVRVAVTYLQCAVQPDRPDPAAKYSAAYLWPILSDSDQRRNPFLKRGRIPGYRKVGLGRNGT